MRWAWLPALLCTQAWAWPVDVVQELEPGKEKFVHLSSLDWFEVEDPKVASVEYLESGEILFTPLKPGKTLVLMYAERKFAVWRLKVSSKAEAPALAPALKACPKLQSHPEAYDKLVGDVADDKCRQALLTLLATDALVAKELDLTFEPAVLQAQLKAIEAGFAAAKLKLSARYEGASLILSGTTDAAGHRKALWEVFRRSAGRVAMDDQVEVTPEPGDAGSADAGMRSRSRRPVHPERSRGARLSTALEMNGQWLDLRAADPTLAHFSRRFFDDGLGPETSTAAFARFDPSRFDARTLQWALSAWQGRTLDEYRSQVAFTEFLLELTELGLGFDVLSTAVRVVRDEARHVELCRRMVLALGGDAVIPGEPQWVRSNRKAPLVERVLRSVIGSLCIGETLSMALLAATQKVTKEPLSRATLKVLAADESVHSQFGWRLLAQLWPGAGKPLQRTLLGELEPLFASAHHTIFEGDDDGPRARNPFGDLLSEERKATCRKSLEKDVLRRFDALKIPAREKAKRAGVV